MERFKESNGKVKETGYGKFVRFGIPFLLMLAIIGGLLYMNATGLSRYDKKQLKENTYAAVYLSMFSLESYSEQAFVDYRGLSTKVGEAVLSGPEEMGEMLRLTFETGSPERVFLGVDPEKRNTKEDYREQTAQSILSVITDHPETEFEIVLASPKLSYWTGLSAEKREKALLAYEEAADVYLGADSGNIILNWYGDEEWLIANPGNYIYDDYTVNDGIAETLLKRTFCDALYRTAVPGKELLLSLRELIDDTLANPIAYPDLRDYSIVFIGDSIFGNFSGSASVPGVTEGLSGAHVYNLGIGGLCGAEEEGYARTVKMITEKDASLIPEELQARIFAEKFLNESLNRKKMVFVINYGINDYLQAKPVGGCEDSYENAMITNTRILQERFPEAQIVIASPTYIAGCEEYRPTDEEGGLLKEYAEAAARAADETGALFLDNYNDLGVNAETVSRLTNDGIHLTETGRLLYARALLELLK